MSNNNNIYIIKADFNFEEDFFDSTYTIKDRYQLIFSDLDTCKNELIKICNGTPDFKHYDFRICVYTLKNNKFVKTKQKYTYNCNEFIEHC